MQTALFPLAHIHTTPASLYFCTLLLPYHKVVRESVEEGGSLRGTIFYHLYDNGIGPGSYGLWSSSGTFNDIIVPEARYMEGKSEC